MVSDYRSVSAWRHKPRYKSLLGAVHKVRHNIFCQFLPHPLSHFVTHPWTPRKYVTHLGTPIFRRPSTKTGQKPFVQILSQLFAGVFVRGVLSGGLCLEGFVRGGFSRSFRIHLLHQKVKQLFKFHVSYV